MGAYYCMAPCASCGQVFAFNPHLVPSLRRSPGSEREPICQPCIVRANPVRRERGLPTIDVLPGAYQPVNEDEGSCWRDD